MKRIYKKMKDEKRHIFLLNSRFHTNRYKNDYYKDYIVLQNSKPKPMKVPLYNTALVLIDMQHDFLTKGGFGDILGNDVTNLHHIIPNLQKVLNFSRYNGLEVIHTIESHDSISDEHIHRSKLLGERAPPIGKRIGDITTYKNGEKGRILIKDNYGCQIIPELEPLKEEYIVNKPGKSAFYNTNLDSHLKKRKISHLIIGGVTTEVCVQTTSRDANDHGYEVCVLEDGCASYFPEYHKTTCNMIASQGGIVGWTSNVSNLTNILRRRIELCY